MTIQMTLMGYLEGMLQKEIDLENFDKKETIKEISGYFKKNNIEEYYIEELNCEDYKIDLVVNQIRSSNKYSLLDTLNQLEELQENIDQINNVEDWILETIIEDLNSQSKLEDIINGLDNIIIWEDVNVYFDECVNVDNNELAKRLFEASGSDEECVELLKYMGYDIEYNRDNNMIYTLN